MSAGGLFNGTGDRSVSRGGNGGPQADGGEEDWQEGLIKRLLNVLNSL